MLIKVRAFWIEQVRIIYKKGEDSPGVNVSTYPGDRVRGASSNKTPSGTYAKGQQVAAIMGGHGKIVRTEVYAEYTSVPLDIVFPFKSNLPWENHRCHP